MPAVPPGPRRYNALRPRLAFGFGVAALVLLLVTPIVTNRQLGRVRRNVLDPALAARIHVSDLLFAFVEELIFADAPASRQRIVERRAAAADAARSTDAALDSLVHTLGDQAVVRLGALRTALANWRAADTSGRAAEVVAEQRALVAAESLYAVVLSASNRGLRAERRLERIETSLSVAFAVVALVALLVVVALERKVRHYAREAEERADEVARSAALRATLVQGIVHDVKNPLNAAAGFAELLQEGVPGRLNEKQLDMVKRLKRLLGTATQTVTEFVELARVDIGEYRIEKSDVDLVPLVKQLVEDHQARALKSNIKVGVRTPERCVFSTSARHVRHVLENLLSNALKYTPAGGSIEVELRGDPSGVTISVSDTGPGIPSELRAKIFEPFFRVPATKHLPGTGVGLAISQRIAVLLGGELAVDAAAIGGSKFTLTLRAPEAERVAAA